MKMVSSVRVVSRGMVALLVGALIVALGAGSASAGTKRFEQSAFGSFTAPGAVTVDQSGGDVYVVDPGSASVQRFDADGNAQAFSALNGQNTLNGSDAGPDADQTPANSLSLDAASQVAVDASGGVTDGTIYVADSNNQVVDIFAASGTYLGQLDGTGTPQGKWADTGAYPCGVAVGGDGKVYISTGMGNQINRYTPAASPVVNGDYDSQIDAVPFGSCSLAVDSTGAIYAAPTIFGAAGPLIKFAASDFGTSAPAGTQVAANATAVAVDPANDHVLVDEGDKATEYDNTGSQVGLSFGQANLSGSHGIAITTSSDRVYASDQPSTQVHQFAPPVTVPDVILGTATAITNTGATLHGTVNPDGVAVTDCHFEYANDINSGQVPCSPDPGSGSSPVDVSAEVSDFAVGRNYTVRLVATNANATITSQDATVLTTSLPTAETLYVQPITTDSATIGGQIYPHNQANTNYHFEWGLDDQYGHNTATVSGAALAPETFTFVKEQLTDLQPDTTYHFRLVATNASGTATGDDHTFKTRPTTPPADPACSNAAIRAQQHSEHLPDCRAYEQVTPQDKNDIEVPSVGTAGANGPPWGQASPTGDSVAFATIGAYPGADSDSRLSAYLATRQGDGWTGRGLEPPADPPRGVGGGYYLAASPDLTKSVVWSTRALTPGAVAGESNIYLRDNRTGEHEYIATTTQSLVARGSYFFVGGSRDFSHVYFQMVDALTPTAPVDGRSKLYEWTRAGLRYVGIINSDVVSPITPVTGWYTGDRSSVSDDGSRAFLNTDNASALYLDRAGFAQQPLSISHRPGDPADPLPVTFFGASNDGSVAVFSSDAPLTSEAHLEGADLYRLDLATGDLETLSAGLSMSAVGTLLAPGTPPLGVSTASGISDDAATVYFSIGDRNESIGNLYVTRNAPARLLASLTTTDSSLPATPSAQTGAQVSPTGRYLVLTTTVPLTASAAGNGVQQYIYDADTGQLSCVSCRESGEPTSGVSPIRYRLGFEQRRAHYVLDDGRTFFDTTASLLPADTNGRSDVYEWQDGTLRLISDGKSQYGATFLDASPNGHDVFITTRDQLVPQDHDELVDVYDARADGGFADLSGVDEPPCSGDSCQPAPAPVPSLTLAGSVAFGGSGNAVSVPRASGSTMPKVSATKATVGSRARLRVTVRSKGRIAISGPGLVTTARTFAKPGTYAVTVSLSQRGRRQLKRRGRLTVRAAVSFTPSGRPPSKVGLTLTFKATSTKKGR